MAKGEVVEFAKTIGAKDLKEKLHSSEFRGFFKRNKLNSPKTNYEVLTFVMPS